MRDEGRQGTVSDPWHRRHRRPLQARRSIQNTALSLAHARAHILVRQRPRHRLLREAAHPCRAHVAAQSAASRRSARPRITVKASNL